MQIRAAVAWAPDRPFEIVDRDIAERGPGEVLVRVKACGICHTDLAVKLQHIFHCRKYWAAKGLV
jgi:Zn-dependent alcohol dehydrogenases, class III